VPLDDSVGACLHIAKTDAYGATTAGAAQAKYQAEVAATTKQAAKAATDVAALLRARAHEKVTLVVGDAEISGVIHRQVAPAFATLDHAATYSN
jgi:methionine synthase I (cobalamin-dependent)